MNKVLGQREEAGRLDLKVTSLALIAKNRGQDGKNGNKTFQGLQLYNKVHFRFASQDSGNGMLSLAEVDDGLRKLLPAALPRQARQFQHPGLSRPGKPSSPKS